MDLDRQLPNYFMHFILHRLEGTVGKNGTNTVLKYTGNDVLIDNYPPRDYSMDLPIRTLAGIITGLVELYGENGYRALMRGVGGESFHIMREEIPFLLGIGEIDYDAMEPKQRFVSMYRFFADKMNEFFDSGIIVEFSENRILDMPGECVWCIGVTTKRPICIVQEDFYLAMAQWLGYPHVTVTEITCVATGDDLCRFETIME
jgi:hypothetical protein